MAINLGSAAGSGGSQKNLAIVQQGQGNAEEAIQCLEAALARKRVPAAGRNPRPVTWQSVSQP